MEQNEVEKLKERTSVIAYLQMIQSVVSRMSVNSAGCKVLVATIITAFSFNRSISWILSFIVILYGFLADSYYLAYERIYREKYNKFLSELNNGKIDENKIYELKPKNMDCEGELFFKVLKSMTSFSVWSYYVMFASIIGLIKFYY